MKGFPNQVTDLNKLAIGMQQLVGLIDDGDNPKDDGILGEAFLRAGVIGKRDKGISIDEYLNDQRSKNLGDQSYRAGARFLRELYELLGFIDDSGGQVVVSVMGRQAAGFAASPLNANQIAFWRRAVRNLTKSERGGPPSHPYQVMLGLVAQKPGIMRAKCALALEAEDDSPEELSRIVALADLPENEIIQRIRITKRTWDNAKKVLPSFAEQLHDVVKIKGAFWLADAPGRDDAGLADGAAPRAGKGPRVAGVRTPRSSREVTPETIGQAGTAEQSDEVEIAPEVDAAAAAQAIKLRLARLKRHNLIVKELAGRLGGAQLYEEPFDILALIEGVGLLIEVKTLDGSVGDERDRVRDALAQLLYYEVFVTTPVAGEAAIRKVACFEGSITAAHRDFLNEHDIAVIWKTNGGFAGDELAASFLGDYLKELR
jgi:hypothetical protein